MVAARVSAFGGMIPAVDDHLLPDTAAARAVNAWLYSGALIGLPQPTPLHTPTITNPGRVFRLPKLYTNADYLYESVWMEFSNPFTDVVRAPVFNDTYDRYYWTSSNAAPRYNTRARIAAGNPAWLLGITPPASAPTVTPTGGSGATISRAYVVTWVSEYGEESAPSPATLTNTFVNATYGITRPSIAAGDLGVDRNITHWRIYRTVTSSAGVATYFQVTELPIATTSYSDTLTDAVISGNAQLQSTDWTPPPADLQGFAMMANGILASWRSNELWFSEAYRPHAWPVSHVLTVEYPIIGLGVVNQTLVVCTAGHPVTATGTLPNSISTSKLTTFEPCTSRGSILSAPEGVYYTSPNGLILVAPGAAVNVTQTLITRDKWKQLTGAARFRSARLGTAYYGFGSVVTGVFEVTAWDPDSTASEDFTGAHNGVLIDPQNQTAMFGLLESDDPTYGVQNDAWSGEIFITRSGVISWLDQADLEVPREIAIWKSKIFQTPDARNFGAMRVYFDVPPSAPALNPVRNTDINQELTADRWALIRLYADDRHVMTRELRESGELIRPPSGFLADFWQFEIETRVKIKSVQIASSVKELVNV